MITLANLRVAAAVNDRAVLANCLARSPDIGDGQLPLRIHEGCASISEAYNRSLDDAATDDVLIFAHQDVYLPAGWAKLIAQRLNELTALDANWAVAGSFGIVEDRVVAGRVWSTGLATLIEGSTALPMAVQALDELVLIVRRSSGVRFDDHLPGFHLYGVDIVQTAAAAGKRCYAVDAPVIHHDKVIPRLDNGYKKAWRYARNKWRDRLPIPTLIAPLNRNPWTLLETELRILWLQRGFKKRIAPAGNPSDIARRLGLE